VTFLTGTAGMTSREARDICDLHELIEDSRRDGPVPVERFALIRGFRSENVDTHERNARDFVRRLKLVGFVVEARGDGENLTLDFGADGALRREVERSIDEAQRVRSSPIQCDDEAASEALPVASVVADYRLGLDVRRLCRRFGVGRDRMALILIAAGVQPRDARPLRLEERRCVDVLTKALSQPRGYGFVAAVARVLGCHRHTARAVIQRLGGRHGSFPGTERVEGERSPQGRL
jgi:hypothetical protein